MSVGAVNQNLQPASFSLMGKIDIVALSGMLLVVLLCGQKFLLRLGDCVFVRSLKILPKDIAFLSSIST
jgi:hypothetical protein